MIIWVRYDMINTPFQMYHVVWKLLYWILFRCDLLGEADDACSAANEVRRMSVVVMMLGQGMLSLGKEKK